MSTLVETQQVSTAAARFETGGDDDEPLYKSANDIKRKVNWMIGVKPQDVRFPTNIQDVAFSENFFASLTSDRTKIFINRRVPEDRANCKKKTIDFELDSKPKSIVSFECHDNLCVWFLNKLEFYNMSSLEKSSIYQNTVGDVISSVKSYRNKSPLGALWFAPDHKKPKKIGKQSLFVYWSDSVTSSTELRFTKLPKFPHSKRFFDFVWTSPFSVLLCSEYFNSAAPQMIKGKRIHLCSFNTLMKKVLGQITLKNIASNHCVRFGNDMLLFCVLQGKTFTFYDAVTLNRQNQFKLSESLPSAFDFGVNTQGNLFLLDKKFLQLCIYSCIDGLKKLYLTHRVPLLMQTKRPMNSISLFRIHPIGNFGALFLYRFDGDDESDLLKTYSSYSTIALVDINGNTVMKTEWPRGYVHTVTDDLMVIIQYLSVKPFSAAHTILFDFDIPVAKRSVWTKPALDNAQPTNRSQVSVTPKS